LYLVRHGETEINAEGRFNGGGVDSPLTAAGVTGARELHDLLGRVHFKRIFVSPLLRAITTEQIVAGPDKAFTIDPRLRELALGDWDGQPLGDLATDQQFINYRHHLLEWDYQAVHAESYQSLAQRAGAAMEDAAKSVAPDGKAMVVSHGIVTTVLANVLTGVPLDNARDSGQVDNASVTVLEYQDGQWLKRAWNVTAASTGKLTAPERELFN
jgi:probable phosphoglycerate mutase